MSSHDLDLAVFFEKEQAMLTARLDALRATISHPSEKGRAIEHEIMQIVRAVLPNEYGLTTGFIAHHETSRRYAVSGQIDIIIYDAVRSGPIARLGTADILPIEAVYGYIETKARLDYAELKKCVEQSKVVRSLTMRRYWTGSDENKVTLVSRRSLPIRAYVVAIEAIDGLAKSENLQATVDRAIGEVGNPALLTGLYLASGLFIRSLYPDERSPSADTRSRVHSDRPLLEFKLCLLQGLARYPRVPPDWTPAVDTYCVTEDIPDGTTRGVPTATTPLNWRFKGGTVSRLPPHEGPRA